MDELTKVLLEAGKELALEYQWCFDGEGFSAPEVDNPFVVVLHRKLAPMIGSDWKKLRIAALKAEIAELESSAE